MSDTPAQESPSFWGPVSLALPLIAVVLAFLVVAGASKGVGGDMVGFGFLLYALIGLGIVGVLGIAAAIRALVKNEKGIVFPIVGILLNLVFVMVGIFYGSIFLR
jgi:hypothetical protein